MEATAQIIIGGVGALSAGGFLTLFLRSLNSRIKGSVEEKVCNEKHKHVDADLERGSEQFKKIIATQEATTETLSNLNTSVILLAEKIK